jgi:Holliday junction resolvase
MLNGMKNPESILTARIVRELEAAGALCYKIHGSQYQVAGLPDLYVAKNGVSVWMEIKTPRGRLQKIQEARIAQMRRFGVPVAVIRTPEEAIDFLLAHCHEGEKE